MHKVHFTEDLPCTRVFLLHVKSYVVGQTSSSCCGVEVRAEPSSLSSNRGSKLRGPSQNIPCVISKRDVNITKPSKIKMICQVCHPGKQLTFRILEASPVDQQKIPHFTFINSP
ncbi:hypothetical protein AVEN_16276-1 [Araneus ventricosus]|uniref:Uncharacterized protein n=1 Tax=Araneus ventricosus TaxID=182803 RepID=A0A4Y2LW57_ARAVE|nr:hypothetical protein AVEN_16276-1 [Araneus ventricosus]